MKFKVLKSGPDGISGDASEYNTIDDVLRQISYHKGWPALDDLHASIRKWSTKARPGDVYCTQVTTTRTTTSSSLARTASGRRWRARAAAGGGWTFSH